MPLSPVRKCWVDRLRHIFYDESYVEVVQQLETPGLASMYAIRHGATSVMLQVAEGSTVIDMTGPEPVLVRAGKGDASLFVEDVVLA